MMFNHFRIVVTLLASFGAFFAYICRLNLSLAMNEMVIKRDFQQNGTGMMAPEFPNPSFINNEEHTLAFISRFNNRRWTDTREFKIARSNPGRRKPNRTSRLTKSSVYGLSIVFNAEQGRSYEEQGGEQVSSMVAPTTEDDQPAADVPRDASNLMNWSQEDVNNLLSAFFYGYVLFQIPSARAAEIFGAKSLFLMTGFGASLCSLAFPFACKYSEGIGYAFVVRLIMGASQGALFPAVYVFLCEWLPGEERSKWLPVPSAFSRFGTIVMNMVLPIVLMNYGWESVFYVSGSAALIWCIVFIIFASNSPQQSRWISTAELTHIESLMDPPASPGKIALEPAKSITASGFSINEAAEKSLSKPSISWWKIITNKAILMLSLVMFTSEWSNVLLLVKLPGFLGPVLKLDIVEIAFWTSILICIYCVQYPLSGYCASRLESAEIESLNSLRVRKIFEAAAHLMQGTGCFMIAFSSDKAVVLIALFLMMLGRATVGGGQCLMPPELSKDYPGTVFAFANTIANVAGIVGPLTVTWLVPDGSEGDHSSWFSLWALSGALFFTGGLVFCLFADNNPQNYYRKPPKGSLSEAQLTSPEKAGPLEQIIKMDAFSRVASEPSPKNIGEHRD